MTEVTMTDELDAIFDYLPAPEPGSGHGGYRLHRAADIRPEAVRWLWTGRVPAGTLTVLDGDPGKGKSTLTATLAAAVSTGRALPGDCQISRGGVIFVSLEDDPAMVIVPRLIAAGADLSRVHLPRILAPEGERLPLLPDDLVRIQQMIAETEAKLVIVDPLMAALSSEVNGNQDQEVRRVLAELTRIAGDTGAAIVIVRHLNKSTGKVAIYRGGGSIGIIGAARSGLLLTQHPADPSQLLLSVSKSNLGVRPKALTFRIIQATNGFGTVEWGEETEISADDALNGLSEDADETEPDGELGAAIVWLREALKDGPLPSKQVMTEAKENGIAEKTLRRAKIEANVLSERITGGVDSYWQWRWPGPSTQGGQAEAVSETHDHLGHVGHVDPTGQTEQGAHIYRSPVSDADSTATPAIGQESHIRTDGDLTQDGQDGQDGHAFGDSVGEDHLASAELSSPGSDLFDDPWDDDSDWLDEPPSLACADCPAEDDDEDEDDDDFDRLEWPAPRGGRPEVIIVAPEVEDRRCEGCTVPLAWGESRCPHCDKPPADPLGPPEVSTAGWTQADWATWIGDGGNQCVSCGVPLRDDRERCRTCQAAWEFCPAR